MSRQSSNLGHGWIFPNGNLILTISMRTHQFIRVLGPSEITYLTSGIDFVDTLTVHGIPETDFAVGGSTS
jgi:hypothetical protein